MPIFQGAERIKSVYYAGSKISEAYFGAQCVYRAGMIWYSYQMMAALRAEPGGELISEDGKNWEHRVSHEAYPDKVSTSEHQVQYAVMAVLKPGGVVSHDTNWDWNGGGSSAVKHDEPDYLLTRVTHNGDTIYVEWVDFSYGGFAIPIDIPCDGGDALVVFWTGGGVVVNGVIYTQKHQKVIHNNLSQGGPISCFRGNSNAGMAVLRWEPFTNKIPYPPMPLGIDFCRSPLAVLNRDHCTVPQSAIDRVIMHGGDGFPHIASEKDPALSSRKTQRFDFSLWIGPGGDLELGDTSKAFGGDWTVRFWHDGSLINFGSGNLTPAWRIKVTDTRWHHLYTTIDLSGTRSSVRLWMDGREEWHGYIPGNHIFSKPEFDPSKFRGYGAVGYLLCLPYGSPDRAQVLSDSGR